MRFLLLLLSAATAFATFDIPATNRITWEGYVGVSNGIPNRTTIFTNVLSGASEASIQAVLDACPSNQVVLLGSGTYTISSGLNLPTGVTLRGSGPTNTILACSGGFGVNFKYRYSYYDTTAITGGLTKGSTNITVASSQYMSVGNFIRMYQAADGTNLVNDAGLEGGPGVNCLGQWVQITSMSGTNLWITPPIFWNYNSSTGLTRSPRTDFYPTAFCEWAGLESLCVSNTSTSSSLQANIQGTFLANCWIKNVRSLDAYGRHVEALDWFRCEIRESGFYGTLGALTSSRGYGINMGEPNSPQPPEMSTGVLIENNAFASNRTAIVLGYGGAGNVIAYNMITNVADAVSTYQRVGLSIHSAHPMFNLFEGNFCAKMNADFFHGSGSHQVFLRNWLNGRDDTNKTGSTASIEIDTWHRYYSAIGNVLGYAGITNEITSVYEELAPSTAHSSYYRAYMLGYDSEGGATTQWDTNVISSLLRHGNYDHVTATQKWDAGYADHTLPNSFYLSGTPSWYPSGYTWPPVNPGSPSVASIPASSWYVNNNGVWDGGSGSPPPPAPGTNRPIISGRFNLSGKLSIQ